MNTSFSTQAGNFTNALQTGVDPRTGQYYINIPLAKIKANNQLGPELDLQLNYSTMSNINSGFGTGFGFAISQFNNTSNQLSLSNSETYMVEPGTTKLKGKRLNAIIFRFTNGINDRDGYQVIWKDGKIENLKAIGDGDIFICETIISPLGHKVTLKWGWSGTSPLLYSVDDNFRQLCNITYGTLSKMTFFPGSNDEFVWQFVLQNSDNYLAQVNRIISDEETISWRFFYDYTGQYNNTLLITEVLSPTGLKERINYNRAEGLKFPVDSGLPWLPCVLSYIRIPGSNQPEIISYYEYTQNNFLGYNGDFGNWSSSQDYIFTTLTDYTYGSEETITSGSDKVIIKRTYNNYHLPINETTSRNGYTQSLDTEYYAKKGYHIDYQPEQFQLATKTVSRWKDLNNNSREEIVQTTFDEYGNPLTEIDKDGTTTLYSWYKSEGEEGAPAEPNGFVRFIKEHTVIPAPTQYKAPAQKTTFTYYNLGDTPYIIQESESEYSDNYLLRKQNFEYIEDRNNFEFGRLTGITDMIYDESGVSYTAYSKHETSENNGLLKQTITIKGHDEIVSKVSSIRSSLNNALLSETDIQGNETHYYYDGLERLIKRVYAPDTEFENITTWTFSLNSEQWSVIERDAAGIAVKKIMDGLGREIRHEKQEPSSPQWFVTNEYKHNSLGEIIEGVAKDWDKRDSSSLAYDNPISITSINSYDHWGERSNEKFSDNTENIYQTDPISLIKTEKRAGNGIGTSRNATVSGNIQTQYGVNGQPLSVTRITSEGYQESVSYNEYDGLGRLVKEVDEIGNVSLWEYDKFGRATKHILPDGNYISKSYAPFIKDDNITSISMNIPDSQGNVKSILLGTQEFDSLGRLTKRTSGGRTYIYQYSGTSPVPETVTTPAGEVLNYTYIPELGNVISSLSTDGIKHTLEYDPLTGDLIRAEEEGSLEITREYFPSGDLKGEAFKQNSGLVRTSSYTYSLLGSLLSFTDITNTKKNHIYDSYGRILQTTDTEISVDYTYDSLGRVYIQKNTNLRSGAFQETVYDYDDFSREVKRTITDNNGKKIILIQNWQANDLLSTKTTLLNDTLLCEEKFEYDNRNRLINYNCIGELMPSDQFGNKIKSQKFTFDPLNNLQKCITIFADNSQNEANFYFENELDPCQLTSMTHTHESYPKNSLFNYDKNGRLIKDQYDRKFEYDALGRVKKVINDDTSNSSYNYDALARISSQHIGQNDVRELYYSNDEFVNEVLVNQEKSLRFIKDGHTCFAINDGKSSQLLSSDGFGSPILSSSDDSDTSNIHKFTAYGFSNDNYTEISFNGERLDPFTKLYNLGNGYRSYDPMTMRFNAPDSLSPFGKGGINPYAYCAGDPINQTDPTGHVSIFTKIAAIFGIVLGVVGILTVVGSAFGGSLLASSTLVGILGVKSQAVAFASIGFGVASDLSSIGFGIYSLSGKSPHELGESIFSLVTGFIGLASVGKLIKQWGVQGVRLARRIRPRATEIDAGTGGVYNKPSSPRATYYQSKYDNPVYQETTTSSENISSRVGSQKTIDNLNRRSNRHTNSDVDPSPSTSSRPIIKNNIQVEALTHDNELLTMRLKQKSSHIPESAPSGSYKAKPQTNSRRSTRDKRSDIYPDHLGIATTYV